jgi:hypothetical protein
MAPKGTTRIGKLNYVGGGKVKRPTALEKMYRAHVAVVCSNDGIEVIKNRFGDPNENSSLPSAIGLLVHSYLNLDLVQDLTPSAMMNIPIKEDLKKAITDVLIKHGLKEM